MNQHAPSDQAIELRPKGRRRKVLVASVAMVAVGGAAFAYWTAGGSGTGSAATGASAQGVTVNQTSTPTGLTPDSTPQGLSGTFDNPNSAAVPLTTVSGEVTATDKSGCLTSWFEIAGTGTVTDGSVPAGDDAGAWTGLTIQLVNDPLVNQDACKGATVTIAYTAS